MDDAGDVYVVGESSSVDGAGGKDMLLLKFAAGTRDWLWTRMWGYSGDEWAEALALDGAGNLYVGGTTASLSPAGEGDMAVLRYDLTGNLLNSWTWGALADEDRVLSLSAYSEGGGGCLVAGSTGEVGFQDAVVVNFSPTGTEQWVSRYGAAGDDAAMAIARDVDGSVLVAGQLDTGGVAPRAMVLRYDQSGSLLGEFAWSASPSVLRAASIVDGSFTVCGASLSSSGNWQPISGSTGTAPGQTVQATGYTISTPPSSLLFPLGVDTTPAGYVEDTGGGGDDALAIWYTPGS